MLPPDPYVVLPWQGARSVAVTFSNYVRGIWYTDALNTILEASRWAAIENFKGHGERRIGKSLTYSFGSVTLTFVPAASLKWSTWGLALSALTRVFDEYEYTGYSFTVSDLYRPAGTGFLRGTPLTTPLTTLQATPQATPQAA